MYSANCAYTQLLAKAKAGNVIQIILFAKLWLLAVGLLCPEARAPFAYLYKSIAYLINVCLQGCIHPKRHLILHLHKDAVWASTNFGTKAIGDGFFEFEKARTRINKRKKGRRVILLML